ncbi:response regulator transcription factor [Aquimarina sp. 2201CG5-10]|uniref:LytR/AlgR family response regulator transcription factor n=1 Tax=Aquimarina callyspongiae TaxID=3098150 RepID=UPI002AB549B6|nr:response regulator transcription factor [Aquimarina sp. 2201CG5-10]MDY8135953.1 response regulator transcription factor [Aquimarina sp. 2201CG5-10]
MVYKCLIVDDEELARELIETHLSKLDNFKIVASCDSALKAHKILKKNVIDLIFLDIKMPVLKGTDFFNNLSIKPKVIFTTAYRDYALEGFELNAIDYLLKPITFSRFFKAIEKFIETTSNNGVKEVNHLYVQSNKKNIKLQFDDILYIESVKDYIRIHLKSDKIMIKHGLGTFNDKLDRRFLRIHRSFIINTNMVTAYTKNDVEIDDIEIPIGEFYKQNVLDNLK